MVASRPSKEPDLAQLQKAFPAFNSWTRLWPCPGLQLPASQTHNTCFSDESTNLGRRARREPGNLPCYQPVPTVTREGRARRLAPSSQQRPSKAGGQGAPRRRGTGPRCPDASLGLRNTPSPGSHKSGFYVAMNRGRQWIYFRLWRNWPSLGLPPAIRSLDMAGPGVPGRHGGLTKAESCPAWGRRFHPPRGLLLAGPSPTAGGSAVGSPGCQQGPAGGDRPTSPSPWAQGWPWASRGVPPTCSQNRNRPLLQGPLSHHGQPLLDTPLPLKAHPGDV